MKNFESLTEKELLKILLGGKNSDFIVEEMFEKYNTLPSLVFESTEKDLLSIKGLGSSKINQIKVLNELSKRLYYKDFTKNQYKITKPEDVSDLIMYEMKYLKQEVIKVLYLNTKNIVISIQDLFKGSLTSSVVHPREVFKEAVKLSAASLIICHNHPSGDPTPSKDDINTTKRLKECSKFIGIEVLDHIIIGNGTYISLKEKGYM